jgi:serine/threonine protein kinase
MSEGETFEPLDLSPGAKLSHYVIINLVAAGGMGKVYKALEPGLERYVAIKVLRYNFANNPEHIRQFQQEACAVAALRHTNIVPIYYIGEERHVTYFAMAYIEGQTLEEWVEAGQRMDPKDAQWFMSQAIAALDYASRADIIHLDLKPSNFMVDQDNIVMLTDFGLSKRLSTMSQGTTGEIYGTPDYIAPEQIFGHATDRRTDIYSLGATLYHLMAGMPPYEDISPEEVCRGHAFGPFPREKALNAGISAGWVALLQKMMEKRPEDRFQDYSEIDAALAHVDSYHYDPITLGAPSTPKRRGLPRTTQAPETLYGLVHDVSHIVKLGRTHPAEDVLAALDKKTKAKTLELSGLAPSIDELTRPVPGDVKDLLEAMTQLPLFRQAVLGLSSFLAENLEEPVENEAEALKLLGLERSRNLALTTIMLRQSWHPSRKIDWKLLWQHQISCGLLTELLFELLEIPPSGLEYAAGLFHDCGKMVFTELYPEDYLECVAESIENDKPLNECEMEKFGIGHAELGEHWLKKIHISHRLTQAVSWHEWPEYYGDSSTLRRTMKSAFSLTKTALTHMTHVIGGPEEPPPDSLLAHAVFSANHLAKLHGLGFSANTSLETVPWEELPSTQLLWHLKRNKELTHEEFVDFFCRTCAAFPDMLLTESVQSEPLHPPSEQNPSSEWV